MSHSTSASVFQAHNTKAAEKAVFSNVELKQLTAPATPSQTVLYSTLQTIEVAENLPPRNYSAFRERAPLHGAELVARRQNHRIHRGQQHRDNSGSGGTPQQLNVGGLVSCSGSHGFSPDGKLFALSCATPDRNDRRVFIIPAGGGTPRLVTENTGYFHSWSPDGKTILFTRGAPRAD